VSDAGDTHAPPTAAVDPHAFPPKPPIWRGADQGRVCARRVVLGGTAALVLFGLLGIRSFSWIEENFLTTSPQRVVLRVMRMEGTDPGDQRSLTTFRYIVALPDRTETRLVSERMYRLGTRLEANTSRSRITGRVLVAGPYIVLAE
jgi:hypothetical protein